MLKVNGKTHATNVEGDTPVLWVLRDVIGLTGTKFGCGMGLCGACTIHVDGKAVRSCLTPIDSVKGHQVTTVESLASTRIGQALLRAWLDLEVVQCGYCQSGQLMSAASLLAHNTKPTDAEIDEAMSGNICRCGTYPRIRAGIHQAAATLATKTKGA